MKKYGFSMDGEVKWEITGCERLDWYNKMIALTKHAEELGEEHFVDIGALMLERREIINKLGGLLK